MELKGKYSDIFNAAKEQTPESQSDNEDYCNMCIRVTKKQRRYWASQAKLRGVTLTECMIQGLINQLGFPPR